ncbi:MAG: hypothetical protein MUD16_08645 [Desulfobacterales bacterium]|nr:hypothetical protein [Desulfobacterales bacterium]
MTVLRIDHQCPQCGAPAALEETDRLFACPFCRVRSVLTARDCFRYVLPAKSPAGKQLIYAPYWRFKGFLLFSLPAGVEHTYVDVNQLGIDMQSLPPSLGLRAQAMKLRFAAPDMEGRFLPPSASFTQTFAAFQQRFGRGRGSGAIASAHLGDAIGLLYSPLYASSGRLVDAVVEQPIGAVPDGFETAAAAAGKPDGGVGFLPALCPACGWDLEGEREALVMGCGNCGSSWAPAAGALTRVDCDCLSGDEQGALYLPFWRTSCAVSGMQLETYADLVRAANLPKRVQPEFESRRFEFWSPAFRIKANVYLRLAQGLSLIQPQEPLRPGRPPGRHHPATLPADEAAKTLKVILSAMIRPAQRLAETLPAVDIRAQGHRLAYLPFREDRHDYIQPHTRIAINKNMLALSRSL